MIVACGLNDPFDIAVVETEWAGQLQRLGTASSHDHNNNNNNNQNHFTATGRRTASDTSTNKSAVAVPPTKRTLDGAGIAGSSSSSRHQHHPVSTTAGANAALPLALESSFSPDQLSSAPEEVQDVVLATELLAALVGQPGVLFTLRDDCFEVTPHVPMLLRTAVQPALSVCTAYAYVSKYSEEAESHSDSLVSMALGEAVSDISAAYVQQMAQLQKWIRGRTMPLMGVITESRRLGQPLLRLVQVLQSAGSSASNPNPLRGAKLLNHLYEQKVRTTGNRDDEALLDVLLRRAAAPYLKILQDWVVEGTLRDPYEEFFVVENVTYQPAGAARGKKRIGAAVNQAIREGLDGVLNRSVAHQDGGSNHHFVMDDVISFERRFVLDKQRVPPFLLSQGRVAKMVYFSGKYCRLLREYEESIGAAATSDVAWNSNSWLPAPSPNLTTPWQWVHAEELHTVVEESYNRSSGAVISLLHDPAVDLLGHLQSIKLYFLHSRGDWLVDFLDNADELLQKSPVQVKTHSIRVLLQNAIGKACKNLDPYHNTVGCSFADTTVEQFVSLSLRNEDDGPPRGSGRLSGARVEARSCMELLQLEVDLQWPLTLVIEPVVVQHLNVIFRLLLWVKVCERGLHRWWHRGIGQTRAHGLKQQAIQFLRQFQFYASHFVLEPQWAKLQGRIAKSDSVLSISAAIQDFFEGVERGLVLSSPHRFRSLSRVLDLFVRFGDLGRVAPGRLGDHHMEATLATMQEAFLKQLAELASPKGPDYHQLVPLLTWVDFSRYYDERGVYRVEMQAASQAEARQYPSSSSAPNSRAGSVAAGTSTTAAAASGPPPRATSGKGSRSASLDPESLAATQRGGR